jgi:Arc/MetJ-type ribon-helix-helix transcriptional regulator
MRCSACGRELNRKEVLYTEDRRPFCSNPFVCNQDHPNSPDNIIARNGAIRMYSEEELERSIFESLHVSDEMKERIIKVATKPQSIRLSKVDIAYYILQLQETKGFSSISEAVRYCIQLAMQVEPMEHTFKEEATTEEEEPKVIKVADVPPAPPKINTKKDEEYVF